MKPLTAYVVIVLLAGIFDQGQKGVATAKPTLVVHTSAEASLAWWDLPDSVILEKIWAETLRCPSAHSLPPPEAALALHQWRFSHARRPYPQRIIPLGRIVLAGDGFGQPSVNGAFTSGEAAAQFIAQRLQLGANGKVQYEG